MHRLHILTHLPFLILMEGYAAVNEPTKAIKTFRAMEKLGLAADSSSFYELLRSLCKYRNVEEAEELLLSNRGVFPLKVEGFNIILDGWCSAMADLVEAKRCWREMAAFCISPDGATYALMIGCFSRAGNLFDSMRLYDEMKKKGWPPGISVYNALIYALAGEGLAATAKKLMKKMEELGLEVSVETYNSLILPLCEARKVDEAREMMEEMIQRGITPTAETYKAFLRAEDMAGTMALLQRMSSGAADGSVFLLLLEKFLRWEQAENALRIWAEMGKRGVEKEGGHYLALVRGLVACGWKPKAMEFYREMKVRGFTADPKLERLFTEVEERGRRGRRRAERGKFD
ncbi:unnamed protein product [Spirodela intermedia]|uniref:Uncharacterized protein n=1 Tax=Spirodela intermedia TaxID=51605 RepID=A0A7I8IUX6_SPIIN|nr:unnamed protein product [Spirodela intermedia]CAA6661677.1 unnamed protein product [Spirodela intermedia]